MSNPEIVGPSAAVNEAGDIVPIYDVPELTDPSGEAIYYVISPEGMNDYPVNTSVEAEEAPSADAEEHKYDAYWDIYNGISDNYSSEASKRAEAIDQARRKGVAIPPEHLPKQHPLAS